MSDKRKLKVRVRFETTVGWGQTIYLSPHIDVRYGDKVRVAVEKLPKGRSKP